MKKIAILIFVFISRDQYDGQIGSDKALHFFGGNLYGLVGAGIASEISDGDRAWTFVGALGGSLLIGLAKESIDEKQYGGWDNADLLATVLGGATIGVTIDIFKKRKQRKRNQIFKDAVGYNRLKLKSPVRMELKSLHLLGISKRFWNTKGYTSVLGAFTVRHCSVYKIPNIIVGRFKVFLSKVHHVTGTVAFKAETIFHSSAWVYLPHRVFGVKIGAGSIIIPRLYHYV